MGLEVGGRGGTKKEKEEKKEEKIPHMCESIGHRPLRGRCPKRRKFPICVKAKNIDPFGAAALLPPQLQPQPT